MHFLSITLLAAGLAAAGAQAAPTGEAHGAAQRDFEQFVQHVVKTRTDGRLDGLPFDVKDLKELKQARVSYGFPVYTVNPNELVAGKRGLHSLTAPTGQFRFVITANGRTVGLATVENNKGRYETVAYGAALLARDVDNLMTRHGNADKSNLRFVRVFQARADLLEVTDPRDGRTRYAPLHSARESLQLAAPDAGLVDEADLLQPLRAAVKTNLATAH